MQLSDFRSGVFTGAPGKAAASKFLWLLGCALPMAATLTLASGDSFALGFEYALDEFEVTGNLAFYDDFEDGLRDSPPTSALLDWQTSVSVEQDGHLILDSDNGFILRPDIGVGWIQGLVELSTKLPDGGTGTSTFAVSVRPDVPGLWPDHYGIVLEEYPDRGGIELGVRRLGTSDFLEIFFLDNETSVRLATDLPPIASLSGNIVLEMIVDHATDTVLPRYSVDGGVTFKGGADWLQSALPGPIYVTEDEADVVFFAFGVPEPSVYLLLATGLVWLLVRCRQLA